MTKGTKLTVLEDGTILRLPKRGDGAKILGLVRESGVLEPNSCYAYVLLCSHFAQTCVVADREGSLQGFIAGYIVPGRPDTVFVWQIGVAESARRTGLGKRMLVELVRRPACKAVRFLETTVTPSNEASQGLFRSFARKIEAACHEEPGFTTADFGDEAHEDEMLFRIGPWE